MRRFQTLLAVLAILPAGLVGAGSAAAQVTAEQRVLRQVVTVSPEGERIVTEEPATTVAPGDRVTYRLTYRNEGEAPASGLVLVMPVPEDIALVEGSPEGPGQVGYSVDGETYAALGVLTLPGGETAAASAVRRVRWTLTEPLAPGASGEVAYTGILR